MKDYHALNGLGGVYGFRVGRIVPRKARLVMKIQYPYPKPTQVGR